jgi:hypothetical protein
MWVGLQIVTLCDWIQKKEPKQVSAPHQKQETLVSNRQTDAANWIVFYGYIFFGSSDLGEQVSFWLAADGRGQ